MPIKNIIIKNYTDNFFNKLPYPTAISEVNSGKIIEVNEAYKQYIGLQRREIIGKTSIDIGQLSTEKRLKMLKEINEKGHAESIVVKSVTKKNGVRFVLLNTTPIKIKRQNFLLTIGTYSSKINLEEDIKRKDFINIFNSCTIDGVFIVKNNNEGTPYLFYENEIAKNIFKKLPLERIMSKLNGQKSTFVSVDSKYYHVKEVGSIDGWNLRLFMMFPMLDSIFIEKTFNEYNLTSREKEVGILTLTGYSNNEIAKKLFISPYTVKDHQKKIFRIIGVRSRSELLPKLLNLR